MTRMKNRTLPGKQKSALPPLKDAGLSEEDFLGGEKKKKT